MSKRDEDPEDSDSKRLLGGLMAENFWALYNQVNKSVEDYRYMIATYCHDRSERGTLLNKLALELDKGDRFIDENDNPQSFYASFHKMILEQWNEWIKSLDPLTQASALAGKPEDWYKDWVTCNPKILTSWIYPGAFAYTRGHQQGSGKTGTNVKIMGEYIIDGGLCAANIQFEDGFANQKVILWSTQMSVILGASCRAILSGGMPLPMLVIIDETAENVSGIDPLKPKNKQFDGLARSFRKLNIASAYISHKRRDFPDTVLRNAVAIFVKPSRNTPSLLQIHKLEGQINNHFFTLRNAWYKGFPDADKKTLPYKTGALASFDMDVDFDSLWSGLSKLKENENQHQYVLDFLESQGAPPLTSAEKRIWSIRLFNALGDKLSQADIGKVVGVSAAMVNKYLKGVED